LEELFYEPFYQIMRLSLLADKMLRDKEFGVTDAKVVVVCPEGNDDYRNTITSPALKKRFPHLTTVDAVVGAALRRPSDFAMTSPEALIAAIRKCGAASGSTDWLAYQNERYGY
jgi:hypothetical protein